MIVVESLCSLQCNLDVLHLYDSFYCSWVSCTLYRGPVDVLTDLILTFQCVFAVAVCLLPFVMYYWCCLYIVCFLTLLAAITHVVQV